MATNITVNGKVRKRLNRREKVAYVVQELKKLEQIDLPLTHRFAPGVYLREIFMPAGAIVIGKIHRTEHFNIVIRGAFSIAHDDGTHERIQAPATFVSKAGVQKVLYIHEDTIWQTVHVTEETDVAKLEEMLVVPPPIVVIESAPEKLT